MKKFTSLEIEYFRNIAEKIGDSFICIGGQEIGDQFINSLPSKDLLKIKSKFYLSQKLWEEYFGQFVDLPRGVIQPKILHGYFYEKRGRFWKNDGVPAHYLFYDDGGKKWVEKYCCPNGNDFIYLEICKMSEKEVTIKEQIDKAILLIEKTIKPDLRKGKVLKIGLEIKTPNIDSIPKDLVTNIIANQGFCVFLYGHWDNNGGKMIRPFHPTLYPVEEFVEFFIDGVEIEKKESFYLFDGKEITNDFLLDAKNFLEHSADCQSIKVAGANLTLENLLNLL